MSSANYPPLNPATNSINMNGYDIDNVGTITASTNLSIESNQNITLFADGNIGLSSADGILVGGGASPLDVGADGQVLTSGGPNAPASWTTIGGSASGLSAVLDVSPDANQAINMAGNSIVNCSNVIGLDSLQANATTDQLYIEAGAGIGLTDAPSSFGTNGQCLATGGGVGPNYWKDTVSPTDNTTFSGNIVFTGTIDALSPTNAIEAGNSTYCCSPDETDYYRKNGASYTIPNTYTSGATYYMTGAGQTITLPTAQKGAHLWICSASADDVTVAGSILRRDTPAGSYVLGGWNMVHFMGQFVGGGSSSWLLVEVFVVPTA